MSSPYVGEIRMFGGNFAPAGWLLCQGQVLPIAEYETLFNLIGTTYGGDGQNTFALPDLQGRLPIHWGRDTSGMSWNIGQKGGVETVTLNNTTIPSHSHVPNAYQPSPAAPGSAVSPQNNYFAVANGFNPYGDMTAGFQTNMNTGALLPQGGSQPHDNMSPFLCINFIIATDGIFPSQT
jgi:microcystin-dependent protein